MILAIKSTTTNIEDDEFAENLLKAILDKYCPELEYMGEAPSVVDAQVFLALHQPDILFAYIHLKDGNIFQLLERRDSFDFKLKCTTASHKYASLAIGYSTIHYLLKPFDSEDVINAVDRIAVDVDLQDQVNNIISLFSSGQEVSSDAIGIPAIGGINRVLVKDIIRNDAERSY